MSRLAGKVAIVTGGAGGIGAATAHELAREGAAVAVVDIDEAKAAGVVDKIRRTGARAIALGGDLAEEHTARHVVRSTVTEFGRCPRCRWMCGSGPWKSTSEVSC
jgi:NAD(P)-dependent dehydrogenase (short-subunit alcohol dehydrogenase family)